VHNGHEEPAPGGNGSATPQQREELGAQLQQEQQDRQDFVAALTERDDRIDELTALLQQARDDIQARQDAADNAWAELTSLREAKNEAVNACRDALRLAHPDVPPDLIRGDSVEELTASVHSAKALVEKVRAALQGERNAARVPAGAPVDQGPSLDGLSAREKIAAGVTRAK
jgi:DNA repair exonuclease SbcCD ATPase subunit